MAQRVSGVKVSVGFASETGPRKRNEDFGGAVFGPELPEPRRDVVAAVADAQGCGSNLNQDPQILQNAATSRQNLLSQLANLSGASNLPQNLVTNLRGAWQSSMEADSAYAKYAQDQIANGCVKNDTADPNYQAAIGPDGQATNYKQAFVALWNPIAMQYGLPTYQWSEL